MAEYTVVPYIDLVIRTLRDLNFLVTHERQLRMNQPYREAISSRSFPGFLGGAGEPTALACHGPPLRRV